MIYIGLLGCIVGDCFRKLAMYNAGKNSSIVPEKDALPGK